MCQFSPDFALGPLLTAYPATSITLTPVNNPLDRRELTLTQGNPLIIGRASTSEAKNLKAATDNALFDCPVVSRSHAELHYNPWAPLHDQIVIKDQNSMHGTTVNDIRLQPRDSFSLRSGDHIKLGERVARGPGETCSHITPGMLHSHADKRASDMHDGVIVTFRRSANNPGHTHQPAKQTAGFEVPTPSDDESPEPSDDESDVSVEEVSSAKTTPEQGKAKLGSQEQPIEVESSAPLRQIINLADNDEMFVQPPASRYYLPTFMRTTAASQSKKVIEDSIDKAARIRDGGQASIDSVLEKSHEQALDGAIAPSEDEDEMEHDDQIADLSDSDASDLESHYGEDEDEDDDQVHKRQPSPELGSDQDYTPYYTAPRSSYQSRYDPVRGSNPPAAVPASSLAVDYGFTAEPYKPSSTYTYVAPPTVQWPAANSGDRSRWDVAPPPPPPPPHHPQRIFPAAADMGSSCLMDPACYMFPDAQTHSSPSNKPFSSSVTGPSPSGPSFPIAWEPPLYNRAPGSRAERTWPCVASKTKISIPDLVDEEHDIVKLAENADDTQGLLSYKSAPCTGTKRKADEISRAMPTSKQEAADAWATDLDFCVDEDGGMPLMRAVVSDERPARRQKTKKSAGCEVARFGLAAVAGSAATVAFLVSPLAEKVLNWLA